MNAAGRRVLLILIAAIVAVAGLMLGGRFRDRVRPPMSGDAVVIPPPKLAVGTVFPDVPLIAENGDSTSTHAVLGSIGGVVMFLEVGCPPCSVMVARWEAEREEGRLPGVVPLFGIASASLESIRAYKASRHLTVPIYSDPGAIFEHAYGVTDYPLRLVVAPSHVVRAQSFDANAMEPPDRLRSLLAP